jgi:hypothetical protein
VNQKKVFLNICLGLALAVLTGCGIFSQDASFAAVHPQELGTGRPMCSTCHEEAPLQGARKTFASFDHTPTFVKDHRLPAGRDSNVCAQCHGQSFCSDCHGGKVTMQPAVKLGNRPDRATPHRGNYLTLHRVEGKLDPSACYKCHGRSNNEKCMTCHR